MIEPTLPWWRRALAFALGGIAGLFRRNGKIADAPKAPAQTVIQTVVAAPRLTVQNQENRVKPPFPHSEPTATETIFVPRAELPTLPIVITPAAIAVPVEVPPQPIEASQAIESAAIEVESVEAAPAHEPIAPIVIAAEAAPKIPSGAEPAEEPTPSTPAPPAETTQAAPTASAIEVSEPIALAAHAAPQEMSAPQETPVPQTEPTPEEEPAPQAPSPHEPESAQASETAPEEQTIPEPSEEPVVTPVPNIAPAPEPIAAAPPAPEPPPAPPPPTPQETAPALPFAEKPAERTTAEKVAAALKAREARGADAEQSPFNVMVNQVYDGPLDLLLDLIRKQDIDIYDIPIAKITAQFLAYVDRLRASDIDVAGEFIYTAALLIHIKSKMLLPRAPAGPEDAAEDPRRELVERLLEHERFKNAAQMLLEKQMLEAATWTNPGVREFKEDSGAEPEIAADTTDLVRVFSSILERARNRPIINVQEDSVTVGQMIQFLARRLTMEDKPVALHRLLSHTKSERALIAMFLALLELVRLQAILLRQDRQFSEIFIKKNTGFDALLNQGFINARDDWR